MIFSSSQTHCQAVSDPAFLIRHRFSVKCHSYLFFGDTKAEIEKENFHYLKMVKLNISCAGNSQLVVLCQVVTNRCCGLAVIFLRFRI